MTSQGVDGTVDKGGRIWPDSNQRVKSSNFAESFLVVEDLALISIRFGKLLTVTHFLITRTSNLFVMNQF